MAVGEHEFSVQILIFCSMPREKNNLGEINSHSTTTPMRVGVGKHFSVQIWTFYSISCKTLLGGINPLSPTQRRDGGLANMSFLWGLVISFNS